MAESLAGSQGTKPGPIPQLGRKGPGVEKNTAGSVPGTLGQPSTMALPGSRLDPPPLLQVPRRGSAWCPEAVALTLSACHRPLTSVRPLSPSLWGKPTR